MDKELPPQRKEGRGVQLPIQTLLVTGPNTQLRIADNFFWGGTKLDNETPPVLFFPIY